MTEFSMEDRIVPRRNMAIVLSLECSDRDSDLAQREPACVEITALVRA